MLLFMAEIPTQVLNIMTQKKAHFIFDTIILVLFVALVMGIPLIFTSYTRSVFEVNKLLWLRIIIVLSYLVWFIRYRFFQDNNLPTDNIEAKDNEIATFGGIKWKKMGLEIPIFIWLGVNALSTAFSQNVRVSIIGAYDRWEGLITVIMYMMLVVMFSKFIVRRFQLHWIIFGLIFPTGISAIYGIMQSYGYDFMHWSQDPTGRVFACINNPV
ncbi:MAG: hypothetical protein ACI9BD_001481, partial [Candidatus Marinamargulisbacteria bacterium]